MSAYRELAARCEHRGLRLRLSLAPQGPRGRSRLLTPNAAAGRVEVAGRDGGVLASADLLGGVDGPERDRAAREVIAQLDDLGELERRQ